MQHILILPRTAWIGILLLGPGVLLPISSALAQDAVARDAMERQRDLARTLFTEGVQLVQERRFAEAEERFREALRNHDAPSIRYNLASVLFEQSELP